MTDTANVPREAVERFKDALENMPDVFERHAKGQKFNAYDLDDDGGSKAVCIGPITSRPLSLFAAPADVAELVEAALKLAANALAVAPKAEAQGWQPIDTAPKDGTHIDVWREEGGLDTVFWGLPHHECGEMGQYCDSDWHSIRAPGWVCSTFHEFLGCGFNPFTHWKPVDKGPHAQPEAPKVEQEPSFLGHVITYPDGRKPDFAPASEGVSVGESCTVTAAFSHPWHPAPASDELLEALAPFARYYDLNDCHERRPDDALEVPISDLARAADLIAKHKGPQS